MAGGGVGEAMLIGAAVGAGTGGVMSAVKDEDPLQGALLGAALGAAGGGIGSWAGGAAAGSAGGAAGGATGGTTGGTVGGTVGGEVGGTVGGTAGASGGSLAGAGGATIPGVGTAAGMPIAGTTTAAVPGTTLASTGASAAPASWGAQGIGQGFAPALTNAQAYGAGVGGGIMGLIGQGAQNQNNMAQEPETYSGPLSQFKYSPSTFRPSVAPGYAGGGVASLGRQTGMYPQSQYDKTQFATPSQMPISREVIGSDYDARISPYSGDIAMARGGISSLGSYSDGGRMLRGPGDGMSDDIPGVIAGKQPARLADGEFVVPADVVSHLGNGSTDAGAKKLYSMMDNVRKARTGSKKQGKQIKAEKYVPGMKHGGVAHYEDGGETEAPATKADIQAAIESARGTPAGMSTEFQPMGYTGTEAQYTPYTMANRPSSAAPQYYGDIYQGAYPDYSTPGYTLAGNLGQWSNVAGEQARAAQPASVNQQITQAYLQNLGRAPDAEGFNYDMSRATAPEGTPISQSNFNTSQYLAQNPDVAKNWQGDPYQHYIQYGFKEGRYQQGLPQTLKSIATSPEAMGVTAANFDPKYYLAQNPDVASSEYFSNPLQHYMIYGKDEGRLPRAPKLNGGGIASLKGRA